MGSHPEIFLSYSATTNRITISGFIYDASGNLIDDGPNSYTFDAENRIKTVNGSGATYSYDGSALRIKKVAGGTTTRYIYSGTQVISEYNNGAAVGSPTKEYIYAGGQLAATLNSSGTPTYHQRDHLSVRVNTNTSGTMIGDQGHYPFGESWYSSSTTTKWDFTNYERDSESGLDYATFRFDSTRLGRFMTPDPIAGRIFNPQSLTRYAYVLSDPINLFDPLGLREHQRGLPCDGTIAPVKAGCRNYQDPCVAANSNDDGKIDEQECIDQSDKEEKEEDVPDVSRPATGISQKRSVVPFTPLSACIAKARAGAVEREAIRQHMARQVVATAITLAAGTFAYLRTVRALGPFTSAGGALGALFGGAVVVDYYFPTNNHEQISRLRSRVIEACKRAYGGS